MDAFLGALQQVVDRHDVYRTAIVWEGLREPVQVVLRQADLPVEEVVLDADGTDGATEQLLAAGGRWLELDRAPLLTVHIAAEPDGSGRWLALLRIHHLVQDHTALEVLLGELQALLSGRGGALPEPLPFREFVAQARFGVSREEHEQHFADLLGNVTETTAPYGLVDVHRGGAASTHAQLVVDAELAGRVREVARSLGVSPATVFHLAWARVLAVVSGRDDVVFGTILFGRMNAGAGADRVPGLFMNTLPVRVRFDGQGVAEALSALRGQLAELLVHEHAPLALAQTASGVPAGSPLFSSIFNYRHNRAEIGTSGTGIEGVDVLTSKERTNYPLNVAINDGASGFGVVVTALAPADPERVGGLLLTCVDNLVTALERTPDAPIGAVPVIDAAQRELVVSGWNDTAAPVPEAMVPELFATQATRTPDAIAVVCDGVGMPYAELDARANRLARLLLATGVGPGSVVGLCLPRGPEVFVAILAVWKAGAAYLPLDSEYPADRLAFMLADSRVMVLVGTDELLEDLPAGRLRTLAVDDPMVEAQLAVQPEGAPETHWL
ncbi:condensation domain-containing protein, partial [Streptomyces shenzhenensis]|uniref:condensation domain-containing protein n=1 Tax=Streptomyces shenzhenensis TaxID=943815 RepID=UPI00215DBCC8